MTFILVTAAVAENSATYWMPITWGGDGNDNPCGGNQGLVWWKRVIIGDVKGCAGAMMGLGIGGMLGLAMPGSNAVLATGIAIAAGYESAFEGIFGN